VCVCLCVWGCVRVRYVSIFLSSYISHYKLTTIFSFILIYFLPLLNCMQNQLHLHLHKLIVNARPLFFITTNKKYRYFCIGTRFEPLLNVDSNFRARMVFVNICFRLNRFVIDFICIVHMALAKC